MKRYAQLLAISIIGILPCSPAFSLARERSPGQPITPQPQLPEGVVELIGAAELVYGYCVNANDSFCLAGDTADLNKLLTEYAKLKGTPLRLTIHPGCAPEVSWLQDGGRRSYNWRLNILTRGWTEEFPEPAEGEDAPDCAVTIDVWLGCAIDLDSLEAPTEIKVVSGREIEDLIATHQAAREAAAGPEE